MFVKIDSKGFYGKIPLLKSILLLQLLVWLFLGLSTINITIPILTPVLSLLYLLIAPGILVVELLDLEIPRLERLLYTVGSSIGIIMFLGFLINFTLPLIHVNNPLSLTPIIITISLFVMLFLVLNLIFKKESLLRVEFSWEGLMDTKVLYIFLVLVISILGTSLMNLTQNNIVSMISLLLTSSLGVMVALKWIPRRLYPFTIFTISLSLLLSYSLISSYITGWDIQIEYYLSNLVISTSKWNPFLAYNSNAMLSVVILAPIFSEICKLPLLWVFKLIYPLIYTLVPLGLYCIFKKQSNPEIAFFSVFFFVSVVNFYSEMIALARQEIAELFMVLIFLIIISIALKNTQKSVLMILFGFSLVVSHYALSYLFVFSIIVWWVLMEIAPMIKEKNIRTSLQNVIHNKPGTVKQNTVIKSSFVLFIAIFTLTWYIYASNSSIFTSILQIGAQIQKNIYTDFLNPSTVQGLKIITTQPQTGALHQLNRLINYLNQLFIIVGFILVLFLKKQEFKRDYLIFASISLLMLFGAITVPFFSSSLNTTRLYHISLILLAPFMIIGGLYIIEFLSKKLAENKFTSPVGKKLLKRSFLILSVYLALFMLYQTGFIFQLTENQSNSISLDKNLDYPNFNPMDVVGAQWLVNNKNSSYHTYADYHRWLVISSIDGGYTTITPQKTDNITKDSYIYFGSYNTKNKKVFTMDNDNSTVYSDLDVFIKGKDKLYDNGGANIYSSVIFSF